MWPGARMRTWNLAPAGKRRRLRLIADRRLTRPDSVTLLVSFLNGHRLLPPLLTVQRSSIVAGAGTAVATRRVRVVEVRPRRQRALTRDLIRGVTAVGGAVTSIVAVAGSELPPYAFAR